MTPMTVHIDELHIWLMGDICCFNIFSVVQINKHRDLKQRSTHASRLLVWGDFCGVFPVVCRRYVFVEYVSCCVQEICFCGVCFLLCPGGTFCGVFPAVSRRYVFCRVCFLLCPGHTFLWSIFPVVSERYVFVEYVSCCVQEIRFCVEYVSCCVQDIRFCGVCFLLGLGDTFLWNMFPVGPRRYVFVQHIFCWVQEIMAALIL